VTWLQDHSPEWLSRITVTEGTKTRHRFRQPGEGYDRNIEQTGTMEAMIEYLHQTRLDVGWWNARSIGNGRVPGGTRG